MAALSEAAHKHKLEYMRARRAADPERFRKEATEWRKANPEKVREQNRAQYYCDRENRLKRMKEDRINNPVKTREGYRKRRKANLKKVHILEAAWRAENRLKRRKAARARYLKKRKDILDYLKNLQRGRCAYCRDVVTGSPHIDHIMPRHLGGSNELSNLQLTCAPCNFSKCAKHPVEFARYLGRLI